MDSQTSTKQRYAHAAATWAIAAFCALGCADSRVLPSSQSPATPSSSAAPNIAIEDYLGDAERYAISTADCPCRGSKTPLVTIVEFVDLHSPFVRRVEPVVQRLLADYSEDVQVCVRQFPIPRDNPYATIAAECAEEAFVERGSDGFFRAYEYLLARPLNAESVAELAVIVPLRKKDVDAALQDHRHLSKIQRDIHIVSATGYTGAPNFYIQGRHLGGARPYADFQVLVEDELNRARSLVVAGIPRTEIYSRVLEHPNPRSSERPKRKPNEPKTVWIREIIVSYGGYGLSPPSRTRAEALSLIQSAFDRIRRGEDFAEVARQTSEGSTAPRGGDHEALQRGSLRRDIEDAAFALNVGGISDVLEGQYGFSIVQRYR